MIMLGAASPATLDRYSSGIKELTTIFESHWGLIWLADEKTRYERWDTLLEQSQDVPEEDRKAKKFTDDRPWNTVIRESAFGLQKSSTHWWKMNVEAPAMKGTDAIRTMMKLEGSFHPPRRPLHSL